MFGREARYPSQVAKEYEGSGCLFTFLWGELGCHNELEDFLMIKRLELSHHFFMGFFLSVLDWPILTGILDTEAKHSNLCTLWPWVKLQVFTKFL